MSPYAAVYCSDGTFSVGQILADRELRFYGQNIGTNTINMEGYQGGGYSEGPGAFISGEGNFFTAYFNTTGMSDGIDTKMAVVISGEKSDGGISNLYYAFVMVAKGDDPNHTLMDVGGYRVFKDEDGFSPNITWSHVKGSNPMKVRQAEAPYLLDCSYPK